MLPAIFLYPLVCRTRSSILLPLVHLFIQWRARILVLVLPLNYETLQVIPFESDLMFLECTSDDVVLSQIT